MALILFTNTFALLADIDKRLVYNISWNNLTDQAKEDRIEAASLQIDDMMFYGVVVTEGQPMKFPRNFSFPDLSNGC